MRSDEFSVAILEDGSEAHTDGLVNEAAALLKAALEPRAPAEAENHHNHHGLVSLYSQMGADST